MALHSLDHVNVKTANLEQMKIWYQNVLGMTSGDRPDFSFPGAWMYVGDHPAVHLVGVESAAAGTDPKIEHFAFSASKLDEFLQTLDEQDVPFWITRAANFGILQVNVEDYDGNHIHIDFSGLEAENYQG